MPHAAPQRQPSVKFRRVLIVDDQQDVGESLAMLVRSFGAEAKTAADGPSALAVLAVFDPDLAIVDIGLPGMDGYELAAQIRMLAKGKRIILAALSGWGEEEAQRRCIEAGFDRYFVKPIDIDGLEDLLLSTPHKA
jgi:CheY-like chemotaxis protein